MIQESHRIQIQKAPTRKSSFTSREAFLGRKVQSDRFQLNAEGQGLADRPAGGTAKVVRLPFMDTGKAIKGSGTSTTYIVGVAGGTASGKTTVCNKIATGLRCGLQDQERFVLVPQDSFYRDLTPEEAANVGKHNFDHPDAFAFEEMVACLKALKLGQSVDIPIYDYKTNARKKESTHVNCADVVLFDGILAFHNKDLRDLMDLKIFVDVDSDTRLARRIRRDITDRGRDVINILDQYESTVKPSHDAFISPTKGEADIIIPRGADNGPAIELVLQLLKSKLTARTLAVA